MSDAISFTPQVRPVPCNALPWPSWPTPSWRACWRARSPRPWSAGASSAVSHGDQFQSVFRSNLGALELPLGHIHSVTVKPSVILQFLPEHWVIVLAHAEEPPGPVTYF